MAKKFKNESITVDLIKDQLRSSGYKNIEREKSANDIFASYFENLSKSNTGYDGRPDFIVFDEKNNKLIIIEAKAENKFHATIKLDNPKDYALDGAVFYTQKARLQMDVIAIGFSGTEDDYKITAFLFKKGKSEPFKVLSGLKTIPTPDYFNKFYVLSQTNLKVDKLLLLAESINNKLNDEGVDLLNRSSLISSIMIALKNDDFRNNFHNFTSNKKVLIDNLFTSLKIKLDELNPDSTKNEKIILGSINWLENSNIKLETLKSIINSLRNEVFAVADGKEDHYIDELGIFYSEFMKHSGGGTGKVQGIVLTPKHITELFVKLAELNGKSVVLDPTAGTGGFLTASINALIKTEEDELVQEYIKDNGIIGVEWSDKMYPLLLSNLIIKGIYHPAVLKADIFSRDAENFIKMKRPNVGFINPPYSQKNSEISFIKRMLDLLEPNAIGIAIVPNSIANKGELENERKDLMKNHSIIGSITLAEDTFHNAGVNPIILIFRAHKKHNEKTYFAIWKEDGLVKKKSKPKMDLNGEWENISNNWVNQFKNKEVISGQASYQEVVNGVWAAEKYMENELSTIPNISFQKSVNDILMDRISLSKKIPELKIGAISDPFYDFSKNLETIKIADLFDIKRSSGISKDLRANGPFRYVGASMVENGVAEYVTPLESSLIIDKTVITVGNQGNTGTGTAFVQEEPFVPGATVNVLVPKKSMSVTTLAFIKPQIESYKKLFNFGLGMDVTTNGNLQLLIPMKNKNIDEEAIKKFMNQFYGANAL